MRLLALTLAVSTLASPQSPVRTPVNCTFELVQKLDLSCSVDDPCPLYLELTDAETVGERIVLAGNIHTPRETLESILLVSDDGGKTWNEGHARIPAGVLTAIQFIDFEAGWISGHVLRPDARDPFFLITSDGGKTWRRRPVYSEPKTGGIDQFRFASRTSGKMIVDRGQAGENGLRYELYESLTSGDSWSIRQVDGKPIPFPDAAPVVKPLRIRADGASKTYRIERQDGNQWRAFAAFTVSLGQCKPEPPEMKEAPPLEPESVAPSKPAQPPSSNRPPPSLKGKKSQ